MRPARRRTAPSRRKGPLQRAGANRANDGQDQARQTYRATLREGGKKLCLIPRTRLRLHLDQIRPHGLARPPFHRLPPMNATEPPGCRKYFHAPARNTRASMGDPIPFNCKCFFSVVQSMLEATHVAVLMTISPRSATEAKRAAMFTVSPTAVMS